MGKSSLVDVSLWQTQEYMVTGSITGDGSATKIIALNVDTNQVIRISKIIVYNVDNGSNLSTITTLVDSNGTTEHTIDITAVADGTVHVINFSEPVLLHKFGSGTMGVKVNFGVITNLKIGRASLIGQVVLL